MKRRTRTRLMLVLLVALLGAAAYAELLREEWAQPRPLTTVDTSAAARIVVECRTCRGRTFERTPAGWRMREPYAFAASDEAVARLLAIASAPMRKRRAAADADAKKLGLDPPVASIRIDDLRIDVGTTDAINGLRYVRHGGDIALVHDNYSAWLLAPPESELDRRLAPPDFDLATVRVDGDERPALAAAWRIVTTSQVVASNTIVAEGEIRRRIELAAKDGSTLRFTLVRGDGRYVALRDDLPLAYPLEEAQVQHLLPPP